MRRKQDKYIDLDLRGEIHGESRDKYGNNLWETWQDMRNRIQNTKKKNTHEDQYRKWVNDPKLKGNTRRRSNNYL